jgi:hypothetical protein
VSTRAALTGDGFDALDVEGLLESYADATRVTASEQLVRRIEFRLAQEPSSTPWRRAWRSLHGLARAAFGREQVAMAVRLQALALLLLCALVLGVAIGGAGALLVSLVQAPGDTVDWPNRRVDVLPSPTLKAETSDSSPTATSRYEFSSTPGPVDTSLAGRRPGVDHGRQPARDTARGPQSGHAASGALGSAGKPTTTPTPQPQPSPTISPQPTSSPSPSPSPTPWATTAQTQTTKPRH